MVYIGGKLVAQTSVGQLNSDVTALRDLEKKFMDAAIATPDPNAAAGGQPLAIAIRRAGQVKYNEYIDKAKSVRILFQSVTGRQVNDVDLEPSVAF